MTDPRVASPPLVAVLAGGRGSRLGGAKPTALLCGKPLVHYPLAAAAAAGLCAVVVAKETTELPTLSVSVIREPDTPTHPLLGVLCALEHAAGRDVLVLGCDMPFLTVDLLAALGRRSGPVVISLDGEIEPFPSRWTPAQVALLREAIAKGASMRDVLTGLRAAILQEQALECFGEPRRLLFNVNDRTDLDVARGLLLRH